MGHGSIMIVRALTFDPLSLVCCNPGLSVPMPGRTGSIMTWGTRRRQQLCRMLASTTPKCRQWLPAIAMETQHVVCMLMYVHSLDILMLIKQLLEILRPYPFLCTSLSLIVPSSLSPTHSLSLSPSLSLSLSLPHSPSLSPSLSLSLTLSFPLSPPLSPYSLLLSLSPSLLLSLSLSPSPGQKAVYRLGLTGVPVFNVNNNCSSGSTALMMARLLVQGGYDCALAVGD